MKLLTLLALGSVTLTGVLAIPQGCPAVTVTVVTTVYATSKPSTTTTATRTWMNTIPEIDVCGPAHGVSCPGAGVDGYYYRCCSSAGHCGPKNAEQDSRQYCGTGCNPAFGWCDPTRRPPPNPSTPPTVSTDSTCGPIVKKKCPTGQCCSGSNFCGTGPDFCGAANWCQVAFGVCHR